MTKTGTYIIRGGVEGKKRLEVLARAMWPTTAWLLAEAGLAAGQDWLDLGCGGGDVTMQLATLVGAQGTVVGLDLDDTKMDLAREMATREGFTNIRFRKLDVYDWDEKFQYDHVYCRFLLTHLAEPQRVLRQMLQAVRPDGRAVVEDIDFGGYFCHPQCSGFDTYVRLYRAAVARKGADADIGPKLHGMMLDAGWNDVRLNVVQPTFVSGEGKQIALLTLINIADSLLAQGLITAAELQTAIDDLTRFTADPRSIISLPRIFQLWGRRE